MIEIKNLYLKYIREYYALCDINLKVQKGEGLALIGDEGSGKTTLLRVLAKLEKYDRGEIYLKEINLKKIDFKNDVNLGYVPLKPVFLENKTVYENLKYVLQERKVKETDIENLVDNALIEYNLERYREQKVENLSTYEKYVISFVRLSLRPLDIVLIDNIFESLSQEETDYIVQLIKKLFISKKVTTLVAASDEKILKGTCKKVIYFSYGTIVEKPSKS